MLGFHASCIGSNPLTLCPRSALCSGTYVPSSSREVLLPPVQGTDMARAHVCAGSPGLSSMLRDSAGEGFMLPAWRPASGVQPPFLFLQLLAHIAGAVLLYLTAFLSGCSAPFPRFVTPARRPLHPAYGHGLSPLPIGPTTTLILKSQPSGASPLLLRWEPHRPSRSLPPDAPHFARSSQGEWLSQARPRGLSRHFLL